MRDSHLPGALPEQVNRSFARTILPVPQGIRCYDPPGHLKSTGGSGLSSAVKRRLIPYNPAEHIELAAENPRRPKPWTPAQCIAFLQAIEGDRLAVLYDLMLVTGLRRGEAIGLRWEDVDVDGEALFVVQQITEVHGKAVVGTPKTKRGTRVVPIDERTVAHLVEHRAIQEQERSLWGTDWKDSGLVFTREDGSGLRPEYATRHFQKLAVKAGLPVLRLHDLRHTNASLALVRRVASDATWGSIRRVA